MIRRWVLVAVMTATMVGAGGGTAGADPARPTNYESTVTAVEPAVSGFTAEVDGGDSFLTIAADEGVTVSVPGYQDEPYLRIDADGTVHENRNSPAYFLNDDRYGQSEVPAGATPQAEPDWAQVAVGGEWAWHDHRIHWMSPDRPPSLDDEGAGEVFTWEVPVEVDGTPTEIAGVLTWQPSQTPYLPGLVLVAALVATVLAGRPSVLGAGAAVTAGGVLALVVSLSQATITPPGAGGEVVSQGAAIAATAGGLATVLLGRRFAAVADLPALIGAILLAVWGLQRLAALWMPVLPSPLPTTVERLAVALAVGAAAGAAVAGFVRRLAPGGATSG